MKRKHSLGAVEGWVITHDGETIKTGLPNEAEAMAWMHKRQGQSIDHAVRYEGYDVVLVKNGKVEFSYKRDILGKERNRKLVSAEGRAEEFENDARRAFVEIFGMPRDPETIERSIFSSYSDRARKLKWTQPDPDIVLVIPGQETDNFLLEMGWVPYPNSDENRNKWDQVMDRLVSKGWESVDWDSLNPEIQIVFNYQA